MFIFFGTRSKKIAEVNKKIYDGSTIRDAVISIYQNYAHVFWIPLFPLMRNYFIYFPDNGASYVKTLFQKMPEPYLSACREVSKAARTPWWTFIGILVFGLMIFWLEHGSK